MFLYDCCGPWPSFPVFANDPRVHTGIHLFVAFDYFPIGVPIPSSSVLILQSNRFFPFPTMLLEAPAFAFNYTSCSQDREQSFPLESSPFFLFSFIIFMPGAVVQLYSEYFHSAHEALGLVPRPYKLGVKVQTCNPSIWQVSRGERIRSSRSSSAEQ